MVVLLKSFQKGMFWHLFKQSPTANLISSIEPVDLFLTFTNREKE